MTRYGTADGDPVESLRVRVTDEQSADVGRYPETIARYLWRSDVFAFARGVSPDRSDPVLAMYFRHPNGEQARRATHVGLHVAPREYAGTVPVEASAPTVRLPVDESRVSDGQTGLVALDGGDPFDSFRLEYGASVG